MDTRLPFAISAMKIIAMLQVMLMSITQVSAQLAGDIDMTFNPTDIGFGNGDGPNDEVTASVVQQSGKILIAGRFTSYNGTARNSIARLNPDGSLDAAFNPEISSGYASLSIQIYALAVQPDDKIIVAGYFKGVSGVTRNNILRLNADGSLDSSFDPGAGPNNMVTTLAQQTDGRIIIGGSFTAFNGVERKHLARLNADGSLDESFNIGSGFADNPYSPHISALAVQADGKLMVGGRFTTFNGVSRNRIARLNTDGTLDQTFNPGSGANEQVLTIVVQPDGKSLVAGGFGSYNGTTCNRIVRLNSNGSIDPTFTPHLATYIITIGAVALQPDGKILIGGVLFNYAGTSRSGIARLNANGTLDTGFGPGSGANGSVNTISILSSNRIVIAGAFSTYDGIKQSRIARVNIDASIDRSFNVGTGANGNVHELALQPDRKILISGDFSRYNGHLTPGIARLKADGTLDEFTVGTGANGFIHEIKVQTDGKILIAGSFTSFNGVARSRIARLNADGSLDTGFNPGTGANEVVYSLAVQPDGKILIGGHFTSYNGTARNYIARLNTNGTLDTSFNPGTGPDQTVSKVLMMDEGKVMISGSFSNYNGVSKYSIARLHSNGTLDTGFNATSNTGLGISNMAIQADGKILATGRTVSWSSPSKGTLVRFNADGSIDSDFRTLYTDQSKAFSALILQPDGKILLVGTFTNFGNRIVRLLANGNTDRDFYPESGANDYVSAIALQADGNIIIGGSFTGYRGVGRNRIARIFGQTINRSPVLAPIGSKTADEHADLTFTAAATDPDAPYNSLSYSLAQASNGLYPTGATINNSTGQVSWRPTEEQGGSVYRVKVIVTDNGSPALSTEEEVQVTVSEVNSSPVVTSTPQATAKAGEAYFYQLTASDADLPANTLTFSASGLPAWLRLDEGTAQLSGVPGAEHIGTHQVRLLVNDGFASTAQEFNLTVEAVVTSLNELDEKLVALYPNPTSGRAVLELKSGISATITLTDMTGRIIEVAKSSGVYEVNLESLKAGIYFITVQQGKSARTVKLFKL